VRRRVAVYKDRVTSESGHPARYYYNLEALSRDSHQAGGLQACSECLMSSMILISRAAVVQTYMYSGTKKGFCCLLLGIYPAPQL
jgi:hypothetical protein